MTFCGVCVHKQCAIDKERVSRLSRGRDIPHSRPRPHSQPQPRATRMCSNEEESTRSDIHNRMQTMSNIRHGRGTQGTIEFEIGHSASRSIEMWSGVASTYHYWRGCYEGTSSMEGIRIRDLMGAPRRARSAASHRNDQST